MKLGNTYIYVRPRVILSGVCECLERVCAVQRLRFSVCLTRKPPRPESIGSVMEKWPPGYDHLATDERGGHGWAELRHISTDGRSPGRALGSGHPGRGMSAIGHNLPFNSGQ
jgi:hypothetical protein